MKEQLLLNGIWKFIPAHDQKFTNNHNVIECDRPLYASPLLVRSDWELVEVPGTWQKYAEKYSLYEGVCWFYREFDVQNTDSISCANLTFKGVNYKADIYVNGKYVAAHESGYTEFFFDITSYLIEGKNSIAVSVDNRPLIVKWPNDWGYLVFGGIHRDVFIDIYRETYIKNIEVIPNYDIETKQGILNVCGYVFCEGKKHIKIKVGDNVAEIETETGAFSTELRYDNPKVWSPDCPNLYGLEISMDGYIYKSGKTGFRNVMCSERKFFLNGTETKMNGVCYVYDSPIYGGMQKYNQLKFDLLKMKEANINAIRTHYPMADDFYKLCDEMGFMVWIEPNVYCSKPTNDKVNTVFKQQDFVDVAVNMTEEMITGAKEFASVVIYGIGNECNTDHPEALPFFEKLNETVRRNDNTRLVGYASLYGLVGKISHIPDIIGINSYYGWYGTIGQFDMQDKLKEEGINVKKREPDVSKLGALIEKVKNDIPQDTPILLTEFGADSVPMYYSAAQELWSENYHASVVREYIKESRNHEEVAGTFVFAFTDYGDPSKPVNGRWNGQNLKGMLQFNREYKLPFFAVKEEYSK